MRSYIHELREVSKAGIAANNPLEMMNALITIQELLEGDDPNPRPPLAVCVMYLVRELELIRAVGGETLAGAIQFIKAERDTPWDRPDEEELLQLIRQFIAPMLAYLEKGNDFKTPTNGDVIHPGNPPGSQRPV